MSRRSALARRVVGTTSWLPIGRRVDALSRTHVVYTRTRVVCCVMARLRRHGGVAPGVSGL